MELLQKIKRGSIITMIISLVLGILFLLWPEQVINYIGLFLGSSLIVSGIYFNIDRYVRDGSKALAVLGILMIIIGIVVCIYNDSIFRFVIVILGIFLLADGIFNFGTSLKVVFSGRFVTAVISLVLSLSSIILGFLAITKSGDTGYAIVRLTGFALIVYVVLGIFTYFEVKAIASDVKDNIKEPTIINEPTSNVVHDVDEVVDVIIDPDDEIIE